MSYYEVVGFMAVGLIAIVSFFMSVRKTLNDDRQPIEDLNINIVKLNANFQNMIDKLNNQQLRLDKHGRDIDHVINKQLENEKTLDKHELRIERIEKSLDV